MVKWGQPTWMFLHTLSLRLTEEKYAILKKDVFKIITLLCGALPCPDCSAHATEYMKKSSMPATVVELQKFLYDFHNSVNIKTGKKPYVPAVLTLYEKVDLEKIFYICRHIILNQPYNPRLSMNKIYTQSALKEIGTWLQQQNFLR